MDKLLSGQTVVISGGLGDIGRATALEFAKNGAAVAICDICPEIDALDFLTKLRQYDIPCLYTEVDITNAKAVKEWIKEVENILQTPTIIIANAAIVTLKSICDISAEEWEKEISVNLSGAFYLTQYATNRLLEKKLSGKVVFVGSWAAATVHQHIPAYSVSKAAMRMLCKCMALELAPHHILVNEIAPGFVNAGLSGRVWEKNPHQFAGAIEKVPIKKIISAEAVAAQILYLCHPQNEHMTGSTLLMDGGLSLLS
jgi:NAD(P)-dependent dehydrogenase (short-subunit alcohol dehydrogenase family)